MNTTRNGKIELAWEREGSGPAILFTHGFASGSQFWQGQVEVLRDRFTCIRWDMPGHGLTGYPDDPECYERAAIVSDMIAILNDAGVDKVIPFGFSLGGYMSSSFTLLHPERVAALVLFGTGPGFRNEESRTRWNTFAGDWQAQLEKDGLETLKTIHKDLAVATTHRSVDGIINMAKGAFIQKDSFVIDNLPKIEVPTLVVVGDRDNILTGSKYLAAKIPNAQLEVIGDAGHPANIEQPATFNSVVTNFLESVREVS